MTGLIIFEGPDCSGKSTAARQLLRENGWIDSRLIHHGPYPGIKKMLPRLYVETMLPMLEEREGQIWDRCWLSEPIYGDVFRAGADRIGEINRRHLERFALRHGAVVVLCLPPWEVISDEWIRRKSKGDDQEYLANTDQLRQVYDHYENLRFMTHLPVVTYDFTTHSMNKLQRAAGHTRAGIHEWDQHIGGASNALIVLVGDKFSELKDDDCNWRLPFASFNGQGSSAWLTQQLINANIREDQLLWCNSDEDLTWLRDRHSEVVIALGKDASARLSSQAINHVEVEHPQYMRRFKGRQRYDLIDIILKTLGSRR